MRPLLPLLTILLISAGFAQAAQISSLSDCRTNGWDDSRLLRGDAFRMINEGIEECFGYFHLSPQDGQINNGRRAELRDPSLHPAGSRILYRFHFFVTKDSRDAAKRLVLAQWHDWKDNAGNVKRPPLSMRLVGNKLVFPLFNDAIYAANPNGLGKSLAEVPIPFGRWIAVEFAVTWKADAQGLIDIRMNGKKIASYRGAVGYRSEAFAPYMKFGLYTTHPLTKDAYAGFRRVTKTLIH